MYLDYRDTGVLPQHMSNMVPKVQIRIILSSIKNSQNSFRVRQKGGVPGPPTRNPFPSRGLPIQILNKIVSQSCLPSLVWIRLENANKKSFEDWTLLRLRNSCPAVPTWGGGILYTEFIQICTMFVVDLDRQHHIHLNSLVFQTKFVSTGKCEKYRFHGESSQNWRVSACPCVRRVQHCRENISCAWHAGRVFDMT